MFSLSNKSQAYVSSSPIVPIQTQTHHSLQTQIDYLWMWKLKCQYMLKGNYTGLATIPLFSTKPVRKQSVEHWIMLFIKNICNSAKILRSSHLKHLLGSLEQSGGLLNLSDWLIDVINISTENTDHHYWWTCLCPSGQISCKCSDSTPAWNLCWVHRTCSLSISWQGKRRWTELTGHMATHQNWNYNARQNVIFVCVCHLLLSLF